MSGKSYSRNEANYRLICYKGSIYKFKIEFSGCGAGKNLVQGVLNPSESHEIDRAVGALVHQKYKRTSLAKALQTNEFLIKCSEKPWKIGKKVGFRLRGEELTVPDFMLHLNVTPRQNRETLVNRRISLGDEPHVRNKRSQGETQQGGAAKNVTRETRQSSSSHQGHDLEQRTCTDQFHMAAQGPESLQSLSQSGSRQQHELPSKQMESISGPSGRSPTPPLRNVASSRRRQKSHELSPGQLRRSPRLLQLEKSPVPRKRSLTVSPEQFNSTANLSAHGKSPRLLRRNLDIQPGNARKGSTASRTSSSQSNPSRSPVKRVLDVVAPRVLRSSSRRHPVRSSQCSPEKQVTPEYSSRFLSKSLRSRSARSSQSSPLKSPERCEIRDRSKPRQRSHSIDSEDNNITKRLRSTLPKLLVSDVAATEKILHPLDKEFVRREYEQEELRLLNLAKPSTTSAERKSWLLSSR